MISDYKLDTNKLYVCSFKDDQYPTWHHPYLKDVFAGTPADIMPRVEEFKKFIAMENGGGENISPMRVVKLGNALYSWNDEVKKFSVKRQAQVRKQSGGSDTTLQNHPEAAEFMKQMKELGFKRAGKKDFKNGGTGVTYTLRKEYGQVNRFPEFTWCADVTRQVGTTRNGEEATNAILDIKILHTDNKNIAANGWGLPNLSYGRDYGYSSYGNNISRRADEIVNNYLDNNQQDGRSWWERKSEIANAVKSFMRQNNLSYQTERVFSDDFQNNYRNNDRLYNLFYSNNVTGKTPAEIDQIITNAIDTANRLTNEASSIRTNNEATDERVIEFLNGYLQDQNNFVFGESLNKNKSVEELLAEVED